MNFSEFAETEENLIQNFWKHPVFLTIYSIFILKVSIIGVLCNVTIAFIKLKKFRDFSGRDYLVVSHALLMAIYCFAETISIIEKDYHNFSGKYSCNIKHTFYGFTSLSVSISMLVTIINFYWSPETSKNVGKIAAVMIWIFSLFITIVNVAIMKLEEVGKYCAINWSPSIAKIHWIYENCIHRLIPTCILLIIILSFVKKRVVLRTKDLFLHVIICASYFVTYKLFYEITALIHNLMFDSFYEYFEIYYEIFRVFHALLGVVNAISYFHVDRFMLRRIVMFLKCSSDGANISYKNITNDLNEHLNFDEN